MSEIIRLRKNVDFIKVYKRGRSFAHKYVVIYACKNNEDFTRVGFTASKKVGKSVIRNRARRLMKESFRKNNDVKKGYDIVFIARAAIKDASFWEVEESVKKAMKRAGIMNTK